MGNVQSMRKINFEDMQTATKNPETYLIINTLSAKEQQCLIHNTMPIEQEEAIINKDGIRVRSVAQPKKKLTEAEWLSKHSESKEARSYKAGGDLSKYSEFIQYEFPASKRLANKFAKKYNLPFLVLFLTSPCQVSPLLRACHICTKNSRG